MKAATRSRYAWLLLLFLVLVFLGAQQDLSYAHRSIDSYNVDEDEIVSSVSGGSAVRQICLLSLAGVSAVLLLIGRRQPSRRAYGRAAWLPLALLVWTLLSPLWADDRNLTLTRTSIFAILCLGSVAMARFFALRDLPLLTLIACATYVVFGLLAELAFGTWTPWRSGYRFAGLLHPNGQGVQCGLLLIATVAAARTAHRLRRWLLASIPVTLALEVLTGSRTALGDTLLVLLLQTTLLVKPRTRLILLLVSLLCGGALLAFVGTRPLLQASRLRRVEDTGSDQGFNGRTDIWLDLMVFIRERPLTGYGHGGFWTPNRITEMSDREGWGVAASHSAYVDTALGLGFPGLAMYVGVLIGTMAIALRRFRRTRNPQYVFYFAVLLLFTLDGLLDSINLGVSLLIFLCMVIVFRLHFTPEQTEALPSRRAVNLHALQPCFQDN